MTPDENELTPTPSFSDLRTAEMDQILSSQHQDPAPEEEEEVEEEIEEEELEPEEEVEEDEAAEEEESAPVDEKVTVKIDGIEKDVTQEDLVAAYQKGATADKRLQEASELLKEAKLQRETQTQQQAQAVPPAQDVQAVAPDVSDEDLAEAIIYGDKEDLAKKLSKRLQAPAQAQAPVSQQDISAIVQEQVRMNGIQQQLLADFPEILNNEHLAAMAGREVDAAIAEGKDRFDYSIYQAAGNSVKKQLAELFSTKEETVKETLEAKASQKKKQTQNLKPKTMAPTQTKKEKVLSNSEIIAESGNSRLGGLHPDRR